MTVKNLFGSDIEKDYQENPELDHYEARGLDENEYDAMDFQERRAVDQLLSSRDRRLNRGAGAILDSDDIDTPFDFTRARRRHLNLDDPTMAGEYNNEDATFTISDLNDIKAASISEWITMEGPRKAIIKQFKTFLSSSATQVEAGTPIYTDRIRALGENNLESLEISYDDLLTNDPALAYILVNSPKQTLQIFDNVAFANVLQMFPEYDKIHSEIHCRISNLPTTNSLRDLRQIHLNCLVKVIGVVSRRSSVFPQLKYVKYKCGKCAVILGPFFQDPSAPGEIKVGNCSNCDSKGPFIFCSEQTVYRNYQKVTLQETPGSVPAGRLPRHREVILLWDLVDKVKPGDEIEVVGIYMNNLDVALNNRHGFPVFNTVIEANSVTNCNQSTAFGRLTEDDEREILELAQDPKIGKRIIHSIAPSIYGHMDIKTSIAFALFGGCSKKVKDHKIRGDINVLLLGDPGTAKSQFLKYAEKTAHRCVYATGQGASAVGLTASVRKDPVTREWTLEGGALVLADRGVCLIDEFDKMNEKDRTSIHEAMEQQSISISKAGIVTSLQARCSVIAAANPIRGRYNPTLPLTQNVDLTEPILSRFDCVCIVRDTVDPGLDFQLANFVLDSHDRAHPEADVANRIPPAPEHEDAIRPIPQRLLRKYIAYARERCRPDLKDMNLDQISKLYDDLRRESAHCGGMTITVRHLESMIRMSEAHARMHLRDFVRTDDTDMAITTFLESFISTQKISVMKGLRKAFTSYMRAGKDDGPILSALLGRIASESIQLYQNNLRAEDITDDLDTIPEFLRIPVDEFISRANGLGIYSTEAFLKSSLLLTKEGYHIEKIPEADHTQHALGDGTLPMRDIAYLVKALR
ncbi:MCM DNA helicase complex subunit [Entomophthora muscae]|uniref:MCM DNA helicase complex subunit n=1 Tax=Entomophthora muscae TaxID=34485 RepID=A0ACC2SF13_9FUNG|nr:MCM DNA helicase complex subunit [Entomophthora muscae]